VTRGVSPGTVVTARFSGIHERHGNDAISASFEPQYCSWRPRLGLRVLFVRTRNHASLSYFIFHPALPVASDLEATGLRRIQGFNRRRKQVELN